MRSISGGAGKRLAAQALVPMPNSPMQYERERAIAGPSDLLVRIFQLVKVQPVGNGKKCMRKLLPVWCQDGWHLTQGWRHI